jgi:hypothetical protein
MNPPSERDLNPVNTSLAEYHAALFANLIVQQVSLAMMFLGQIAHPETGQPMLDLEGARLIIDQLEMIQAKTRGNLSPNEEEMLKESLTNLHLAFVQQANAAPSADAATIAATKVPASATAETPNPPSAVEDTESKKKFTKKYGQE